MTKLIGVDCWHGAYDYGNPHESFELSAEHAKFIARKAEDTNASVEDVLSELIERGIQAAYLK